MWPRQILELGKQFNLMIRLQNILKASLQDVLKMSWRRFCKTSWRRLEDVWPRRIYWSWSRRLEDVFKTSSEDEWLRRIYSSWSRRLLKTKTSSTRRMFAGLVWVKVLFLQNKMLIFYKKMLTSAKLRGRWY